MTGNSNESINRLIHDLGLLFSLKDLGPLNYFLAVEVVPHTSGIILSQQQYITNLLAKTNMATSKAVSPFSSSAKLSKNGGKQFSDPTLFRQVVGSLQYLSLTRPNIAFSVSKVCQFMHAPIDDHWTAVKRILRYVPSKHQTLWSLIPITHSKLSLMLIGQGVRMIVVPLPVALYTWVTINLVTWASRKQKIVARSSTESEYKALADTAAELQWLQSLLQEIRFPLTSAPTLWRDNIGAAYLASNPMFHARTKQIEIDFHFVRDMVARKTLKVNFISTQHN